MTEFRAKFPNWKEEVSNLIKIADNQKQKKEAKKKAQLKKKLNSENDEQGDEKCEDEATSDEDKIEFRNYDESVPSAEGSNANGDHVTDSDNGSESAFVTSLRNSVSSTKEEQQTILEKAKPKKAKKARKNIDKNEGEVLIKVLNLEDKSDGESSFTKVENDAAVTGGSNNNLMNSTDRLSIKQKPGKVKSSFFLGGESESEEENVESEDEEEPLLYGEDVIQKKESIKLKADKYVKCGGGFRRGRGRGDWGRGGFRGNDFSESGNFRGHEMNRGNLDSRGGAVGSFRGRGSDFRRRGSGQTFENYYSRSSETLHPSWAAKRKVNNPGMVEFQGKKTKFSDDPISPFASKPVGKSSSYKPPENSNTMSEKIHPSWAAKQSIRKPVIQCFQGKKTTFD